MKIKSVVYCVLLVAAGVPIQSALAKVSAEKAKELDGPKLTCVGAEKAGTPSGVAEYTGKWLGDWPRPLLETEYPAWKAKWVRPNG